MVGSKMSGFYKLSIDERIGYVASFAGLNNDDTYLLYKSFTDIITRDYADKNIENCICGNPLIGVVTNAKINGKEYLIPVCTEEASIIAGASRAFKTAYSVEAESLGNKMKGQIFLTGIKDVSKAESMIKRYNDGILGIMNKGHKYTSAESICTKILGDKILVEPVVNTGDIQGANTINKMCESVASYIEDKTEGKAIAKIISNSGDLCVAKSKMKIKKDYFGRDKKDRETSIKDFLDLSYLAEVDKGRATTNNKGIMNGIIGVGLASGQDTRAIEAAAHSYACKKERYTASRRYTSLSRWYEEGDYLVGELKMPMPVGIIGGSTKTINPELCLKILGVKSAEEFQEVLVSVGLANNFAAMHAIVTDGISKGHIGLHEKKLR